jgi:hypothetical protein
MSNIPGEPYVLLDSKQGAAALTDAGFKTAAPTLETLRCRGGGPIFHRYGRRIVYRWADLLRWAEARLSAPLRSTSELDALRITPNNKPRQFVAQSEPRTPESGRNIGDYGGACAGRSAEREDA